MNNRRRFLKTLGWAAAGLSLSHPLLQACSTKPSGESTNESTATGLNQVPFFQISLAEWSLHKALFANEFTNLDFPIKAKTDFGISAVEYVNAFFKDKAKDTSYLNELKKRCDDHGVASVLIMCDGEGEMANLDAKKRQEAVENHFKWVEAAKFLGCHSIRVNCFGVGTAEEVAQAGSDGLRRLSEFAQPFDINVIVENHGGFSSNGKWLSSVIRQVGLPNCGTLPDFGNFCIRREKGDMWESPCVEMYDRYTGVSELMPFAKGVSAKSNNFDAEGNCVETDYFKMLPIVKAAGYTGHIGIEYEGSELPESEGILATKKLLERVAAGM